MKSILEKFKFKNLESLFKSIGTGKVSPVKIISSMFPEEKLLRTNKKIILFNRNRRKSESKSLPLILKDFTPGMSIHFANCCSPIPGDDAVAVISEGKGLIIHINTY